MRIEDQTAMIEDLRTRLYKAERTVAATKEETKTDAATGYSIADVHNRKLQAVIHELECAEMDRNRLQSRVRELEEGQKTCKAMT